MIKKIIIVVLVLILLGGFLFWKFGPTVDTPLTPQPITLNYWGLWEEESVIRPAIEEYKKIKPNVTINYERKSSINYRTRTQTQIETGGGPDIFLLHNSWINMFYLRNDLSPAPADVLSLNDFQASFYPIAVNNFVRDNQIYAAPIEVDGIAMFYNEDILNGVGVSVPRNWQEFIDAANKTTVKDQNGVIKTSGAAMGLTGNVDHWPDILGTLLLQQPGVDLSGNTPSIANPKVAEILSFFTGFVTDSKRKTWDESMPSSTESFAQNRLAFYFAPSWRAHELRQMNPSLNFKIAPVPQLSGKSAAWATFWAQAVSARSQHPKEAWEFIKFLTSSQVEQSMYQQASQVRLFGQPYSRVDLNAAVAQDPLVGAFVKQGPYYGSWYLNSNTFDAGVNDAMIKYFEDGVNAVVAGEDPQVALQTVEKGVHQVLKTYNQPPTTQTQQTN